MRALSVDALRGTTVAAMLLVNNPGDWGRVFAPFLHADWHGCTPTDLIFPFFLFVVGVSIALAVLPKLEAGGDPAVLRKAVVIRALRILVLGLVLHAIAHWVLNTPSFRPFGVLQRIALCFGATGLIVLHTKPRTQWIIIGAILLGYWALLAGDGTFAKEVNLASRIDTALLGRFAYQYNPVTGLGHEPEGLLSTLPAIATTLLGVRAGDWLRRSETRRLWQAGIAALIVGGAWSLVFPLNKSLWTSSFVLWTGGWAMLTLAALHWAIDRRGWPAAGRRFGVNAIAAYAGAWLMSVLLDGLHWKDPIYQAGFAWMAPRFGPAAASLAYAIAFVAIWWAVVVALDKRKVYFKI